MLPPRPISTRWRSTLTIAMRPTSRSREVVHRSRKGARWTSSRGRVRDSPSERSCRRVRLRATCCARRTVDSTSASSTISLHRGRRSRDWPKRTTRLYQRRAQKRELHRHRSVSATSELSALHPPHRDSPRSSRHAQMCSTNSARARIRSFASS